MSSNVCLFSMFIVTGMIITGFGILVRTGGYKKFYTIQMTPVIAPQAYKNALIPLGISIMLLSLWFSNLIPPEQRIVDYIILLSFVASVVLGIWNPRWLKPRWLVYLEDTYGRDFTELVLLPTAGDEANWSRRMQTLDDVKMWAAGIAEQQGFPPELGHNDREM